MIKLRAPEPEDIDFILECEDDIDAKKWSDYRAPFSRHQLLQYLLNYNADPFSEKQLRLIAENDKRLPIGIADLYEISEKDSRSFTGITIHPDFRGKGVGLSVLESLCAMVRDSLGLRQLAAKVALDNSAAVTLFKKAGFKSSGILRKWFRTGLIFHDVIIFQRFL